MTSELIGNAFESRLRRLTKIGNPYIMGTPLCILNGSGDELFIGEIENSTFRLTNNSGFSTSGAIIEGEYIIDGDKTKVEYKIKTMWFPYFWVRFIPIVGILLFNTIVIVNSIEPKLGVVFLITIAFGLGFLFGRWNEKRKRRELEERFVSGLDLKNY